jgi:hypothetical protein
MLYVARFQISAARDQNKKMLTAYLSIFEGIPYISLVLVTIASFSLILQKCSFIARSILFSFGFWLAPLFYITYIALGHQASPEILSALAIECIILVTYQALFSSLLSIVSDRELLDLHRLMQWLKLGTIVVVVLALPLLFAGQFGIFSNGSRNDYLADSKLLIYTTYASLLIQAAMVPVIAAILNCEKKWNKLIVFYLAFVSVLSVLGGSKGGGVLSICAILSLLKFRRAIDYVRLLRLPFISIVIILSSTVYYLGRFLALEPLQMIWLMFARIFINNDARALAIDFSDSHNLSLFRESFRSFATFLGSPPVNPALGQYLYTRAFQSSGFVGANTSSTALLIAYGGTVERTIFCLFLCSIAVLVYLLTRKPGRYSIVRLAIGINFLFFLSQDFLGFQLAINLMILLTSLAVVGLIIRRLLLLASNSSLAI